MVVDTLAVCLRLPGVAPDDLPGDRGGRGPARAASASTWWSPTSPSRSSAGWTACASIRFVTANFPDTAVYVLSGYVDEAVRELCSVLGVTAVLEKSEGPRASFGATCCSSAGRALAARRRHRGEGEVQQVELLEDFLAANTIRSVLQPVVKLQRRAARRSRSSASRGWRAARPTSVLGSPAVLLAYAAHKELLFEADMICIRAALAEVLHLGSTVTTFLNVQPRSLTNPEFASRALRRRALGGDGGEEHRAGAHGAADHRQSAGLRGDAAAPARARLPHRARRLRRGLVQPEPVPGPASRLPQDFRHLLPRPGATIRSSRSSCRAPPRWRRAPAPRPSWRPSRRPRTPRCCACSASTTRQGYFFSEPLPGRELAQLLRVSASPTPTSPGLLGPLGRRPRRPEATPVSTVVPVSPCTHYRPSYRLTGIDTVRMF